MMRQPFNSATTSASVLSLPAKSRLRLFRAFAQRTGFHCHAGFVHGESIAGTKSFTPAGEVFRRESSLERRSSGLVFVCNARKSYGNTATLYFDGSSEGPNGPGGGGAYLLHPNGNYIWRGYRYFEKASAIKAEYGGVVYGLERARDAGIKYLTIYGDSDEVIEHLLGKRAANSDAVASRLAKAEELCNHFKNVKCGVIPRGKNSTANQLARAASSEDRVLDEWFEP